MDRWSDKTISGANEFQQLTTLGLLPPFAEFTIYSGCDSPAEGWLALWKAWLRQAPKSRRSRAARIHSWLQAAIANGAELTFQMPGRGRQVCDDWLGRRIYWWPNGIVEARGVGIVSSRLQRDSAAKAPVLDALRLSVTTIAPSSEHLVASIGTPLHDFIQQCTLLFDLPLLQVFTTTERTSSKSWLDELIRTPVRATGLQLLLSPTAPLPAGESTPASTTLNALLNGLPIRDRVVALLSRRLFVLSLRRNGNWWKLLHAGFESGLWDDGAVRAVVGEGLCTDMIASELQDLGAARWYLSADNTPRSHCERPPKTARQDELSSTTEPICCRTIAEQALVTELVRAESSSSWLLHWTRTPRGKWAGESRDEYLTDSVLGNTSKFRSAFETLKQIINERVIRATPGNTRAGVNVVCLTGVVLITLAIRRVFRQHRGRWDFEHYGCGIRTKQVRACGGRPVIYGNEADWRSLPEGERPWFQLAQSTTGHEPIDWTIENEWRLTASLDLDRVPADDVFVFCATEMEAARLRLLCPWRVVSMEVLTAANRDATATGR